MKYSNLTKISALFSLLLLTGCYTQLKISEPVATDRHSNIDEYRTQYGGGSYSSDMYSTGNEYTEGYRDGFIDANWYFRDYEVYQRWNYSSFYSPYRPYHMRHFDPFWGGMHDSYYANGFFFRGYGYSHFNSGFYSSFYGYNFYGYPPYYGSGYGHGIHPNYYVYYHDQIKQREDTKYTYGPRGSGSTSIDGRSTRTSGLTANQPRSGVSNNAYWKSLSPDNDNRTGIRSSRVNSNEGITSFRSVLRSLFSGSPGDYDSATIRTRSSRVDGPTSGFGRSSNRKSSGSGYTRSSSSSSSSSSGSGSKARPSRVERNND